jgi:hypothetical protein
MNDWTSFSMINSLNEYNNEFYHIDTNNNSWIPQTIPPSFNYYDFYLMKSNDDNISSIYFDDNSIIDSNQHIPSYYLRCMTPSIERECEEYQKNNI